jgi:hypothetical protein
MRRTAPYDMVERAFRQPAANALGCQNTPQSVLKARILLEDIENLREGMNEEMKIVIGCY